MKTISDLLCMTLKIGEICISIESSPPNLMEPSLQVILVYLYKSCLILMKSGKYLNTYAQLWLTWIYMLFYEFHMIFIGKENHMTIIRATFPCVMQVITHSYDIKSFLPWAQYSMVKSLPPWFVQCQTVCIPTLKGNQSNSGAMIWWNMVMKSVTNKMVNYILYFIFNCKEKKSTVCFCSSLRSFCIFSDMDTFYRYRGVGPVMREAVFPAIVQ